MKTSNTVGTSVDAAQKKIINDNVALWRRKNRNRTARVVLLANASRFNAIADAMPRWHGGAK